MKLHLKSEGSASRSLCGAAARPADLLKKAYLVTCVNCLVAHEEGMQRLKRAVAGSAR